MRKSEGFSASSIAVGAVEDFSASALPVGAVVGRLYGKALLVDETLTKYANKKIWPFVELVVTGEANPLPSHA